MSESNLDKLLTINGRPGLFRMVSQTRSGLIATSLADKKKIVTTLGKEFDIISEFRVFGLVDDIPLNEIFEKIFQLEKRLPVRVKPDASKEELESYFFDVFHDHDLERVYANDIKKIIQWYNLLLDSNELKFDSLKEDNSPNIEEV